MATARKATNLAKRLERTGRSELRRKLLPGTVTTSRAKSGSTGEHFQIATPTPVVVPRDQMGRLPGQWTIRMSWDVYEDPADGDARVMMSSVSLNVSEILLTSAGDYCLVRYDTNRFNDAPSRSHSAVHLNVLQPSKLGSKVHYPVFGLDHDVWPLDQVLDFFLSADLQEDLSSLL